MKRSVAVCMVAALLLAASTAAFATPITVTQSGDVAYDNTVSSGFTKSSGLTNITITWFQPYAFVLPAGVPDFSAYPAGGTLTGPTLSITSASLSIVAYGVNPAGPLGQPAEKDAVSRGSASSGPWTSLGVNLTPGPSPFGLGNSTTNITLSSPTWVAPTGFYVQVKLEDGNEDDVVKSSRLQVTTHWEFTYTYDLTQPPDDDDGQPGPTVPAPGAILLASLGAGLVSWLRARKAL